ncbi:phosphoglycerate kinase [Thioalkalivibrio sp. HK1]|uniref:phosphoglycerate kinase n=1 Tax=Thioalkalivibrio sp. HK1 TaxID=1469245 RepID=UPI0004B0DB57|nr:phosphoglycerate kinase [Thioalkalivibrio sp. HK1]
MPVHLEGTSASRIPSLRDFDLEGRRLLIREDLNVPIKDGVIGSDARIRAALPGLRHALEAGGRVLAMSHLGRPKPGRFDPALSMAPVAVRLGELLDRSVRLIDAGVEDWPRTCADIEAGQIALLENLRFLPGEVENDDALSSAMAGLCDIYVMDAFGSAHRAHASTCGVARFAPCACAGPLLEAELEALGRALAKPDRPLVAVVGGAKVSTKLGVLESLAEKVDGLIPGGGIANTFIAAAGFDVGASLMEPDLVDRALRIRRAMIESGKDIPLPVDVVVSTSVDGSAPVEVRALDAIAPDEMILDIGPQTARAYGALIEGAGTVVWNGPLGVFERTAFAAGTCEIAKAIARSSAFSIAGGGDTLAAASAFEVVDDLSYLSTGGGAFLEFLEGRTLPGVSALEARLP